MPPSPRRTDVSAATAVANGDARARNAIRIAWLGVLLLTIALYLPGLQGYFEFDDYPNIVDNDALHVTTLAPSAWIQAMWASPSSDLQRPLASLSFALNFYLTGPDPWPMKATNLAIHLLNGWLLFGVLRRVFALARRANIARDEWLALIVSAVWMLHPINLTPVLFTVQRMEAMAQTFVLLGLLCYTGARTRQIDGRPGAGWRLWIGFPLSAALGIASKESAVLLPLYALALEATVLAGAMRPRSELRAFYLAFLIVPGCVGLAWILPHVGADAYASRPFTLAERLMTEPRVLVDYALWTLVPLPFLFSFFHDDFAISTGPLQPWTTLPSMLAIAALAVAAFLLRRRRPLVALGLAWFLTAQALTATVIPLELVFEHRNYFASAGLLLAAVDLLLGGEGSLPLPIVRTALVGALSLLCAFSLALRAHEWSDPVKLAVTEAARHPDSPRATYELGRTFVVLSDNRAESPNATRAFDALEKAMRVPRATIMPETGIIMLATRTGRPIDDAWWQSIVGKLEHRKPTVEDTEAIKALTLCQRRGYCALDDGKMLGVFLAALENGSRDPGVLYSYAIFAFNRLHDRDLALRLAREATDVSRDPQYRINLANFLIDLGQLEEAQEEIARLRSQNRLGALTPSIRLLEERSASARNVAPADH